LIRVGEPSRKVTVTILSLCRGANGLAQAQHPVFNTETAGVVVDVIVTDRTGRHVPGLEASAFKLYEGGAAQTIRSFSAPEATGERRVAVNLRAASVITAQAPSRPTERGPPQLITLVIDTGDLQFECLKPVCSAASKFAAGTMDAGNQVALYWVNASLHLAVPFTEDRPKVVGVLKKIGGRAPFGQLTARERKLTQSGVADLRASIRPVPQAARAGG
jgi:VWFA-related protein